MSNSENTRYKPTKIPVVVRKWRDSNKLFAMFVTTPYNSDHQMCMAYSIETSTTWCNPIKVARQTVEVSRTEAEEFLERIDHRRFKKEINENPDASFEIQQRDRVVRNALTRKEKLDASSSSKTIAA